MDTGLKPVPAFANQAGERAFREARDSTEPADRSEAVRVRLPGLRPSRASISLRLAVTLLERIEIAANEREVPRQSLSRAWLAEKADGRQARPGHWAGPGPCGRQPADPVRLRAAVRSFGDLWRQAGGRAG